MRRLGTLLGISLLLALGSCDDSTDPVRTLLRRYFALGGATAAGFSAGGLTAASQQQAYPALLAARAGEDFDIALIADPGCPAPFTGPLTPPGGVAACDLQDEGDAPGQLLAIPGERVASVLTPAANPPASAADALKLLLLDERTAVEVADDGDATFVTLHVGEADVMIAAASGILGVPAGGTEPNLTTTAAFTQSINEIGVALAAIESLEGAAVIGLIDPVISSPIVQRGAFFFLARDATGRFNGKLVNNNCSPVTPLGQPNPLAANLVSFDVVASALGEINCDPAQQNGQFLLDVNEQAQLRQRVSEFNLALATLATQQGWVFVDPNTVVAPLLTETDANGRFQQIRKCQLLPAATNAAQFQVAVLNSCPVTGATSAPNLFGAMVSFDAVNPTAAFQTLLADEIARQVNIRYGPIPLD